MHSSHLSIITRFVVAIMLTSSYVSAEKTATTARDAWNSLLDAKSLKDPAYAFVENDPDLPNVLIYGDSISIHYTPAVREALVGKANVYRLYRNGSDSSAVIPAMNHMLSVMCDEKLDDPWDFQWNVIQLNVGLHDLKHVNEDGTYDTETGKQVTPIPQYQANLRSIIAYLKNRAPDATLIFATTTPVPENSTGRLAGDAARYNRAAREVLQQYPEIVINDLYTLTKPNHPTWWSKPGNVHFNEEGIAAQARRVARVIVKALD